MFIQVNRAATFILFLLSLTLTQQAADAQQVDPRFGVGFNALVSSADGVGVGLRGRASAPINVDLSAAVDLGLTGFIFGGRRDADYIIDPQVSAIVSLPPQGDRLAYILFGIGAYLPVGDSSGDERSGPTLHGGIGWVHALRETSVFYEINPALVIGRDRVDVAIPLRFGIIF